MTIDLRGFNFSPSNFLCFGGEMKRRRWEQKAISPHVTGQASIHRKTRNGGVCVMKIVAGKKSPKLHRLVEYSDAAAPQQRGGRQAGSHSVIPRAIDKDQQRLTVARPCSIIVYFVLALHIESRVSVCRCCHPRPITCYMNCE